MGPRMDEQVGTTHRPVGELSYAEASAELDDIVGFFEGRDVDVDQLVGQLVRATEIIEELDNRLRRTQTQVEQLVPRLTAVLDDRAGGSPPSAGADDGDGLAGPPGGAGAAGASTARVPGDLDDDAAGVGDDDTPGLF